MIAGYFHGEYMHEDMQTSDAAPIYGLCIDKMNTRKSRSRKWKWSHNAIVKCRGCLYDVLRMQLVRFCIMKNREEKHVKYKNKTFYSIS